MWSTQRIAVVVFSAVGACILLLPGRLEAGPRVVPVIDLHVDLSFRSLYKSKPFAEGGGRFAARRLEDGGLQGVVLPLYVPEYAEPHGRSRFQLERSYAHVFDSLLKTPPYSLPGCGIGRAGAVQRPVSTWLAFEGAAPVGADEREIRKWVLRGVRVFGLVHSVSNALAASSGRGGVSPRDTGLSSEGKKFVRMVYRAGGVVDVSHASDRSVEETLAIATELRKPVIATHSNARALAPHARNLTDRHIRALAATGGVIGVNFHQPFLASAPGRSARLRDVVGQILHIRRLGGTGAVAIGSDFEGGISPVPELSDAGRYQRLASALRDAGLSEGEVKSVMADNARRVLCGR